MFKVLVVCHGNKWRSPLCASALEKAAPHLKIISAGFRDPDSPAAKRMREAARKHGFELGGHTSQLVTPELIEWADVIIYMDSGNRKRLEAMGCKRQLVCLAHYAKPRHSRIPDPAWIKEQDEFDKVVELILSATANLASGLFPCPEPLPDRPETGRRPDKA